MTEPAHDNDWFYWLTLILCCLLMLALGVFELMQGASVGSRFYAIDDIAIRILGAAMIAMAFGLPTRRGWAFAGAIGVFGLSVVESFVTFPAGLNVDQGLNFLVTVATIYGMPLVVLLWLRRTFTLKPE